MVQCRPKADQLLHCQLLACTAAEAAGQTGSWACIGFRSSVSLACWTAVTYCSGTVVSFRISYTEGASSHNLSDICFYDVADRLPLN